MNYIYTCLLNKFTTGLNRENIVLMEIPVFKRLNELNLKLNEKLGNYKTKFVFLKVN